MTVLLKSLMNSRRLMGFTPVAENHLRLKSNTIFERELCTASHQNRRADVRCARTGLMHCSVYQQIIDNSFGWRLEAITRERQQSASSRPRRRSSTGGWFQALAITNRVCNSIRKPITWLRYGGTRPAAEYDRAFAHVTRYFMPFVLRTARITRGMRVLDIAAGTGLSAEAAKSGH